MNNKQKLKKKKKKEVKAKNRVLARRNKIREQNSKTKKEEKDAMKYRDKVKPIVNVVQPTDDDEEKIKERLESHLKTIQKEREEFDVEEKNRKELNEWLESKGHLDLKSKMEELQKMAVEKNKKEKKGGKMKGSAKVKFTTNN